MLKVLDLFSGIGGFSLGLERTGRFQTVAFCEIEKFPRKVLKKHWPNVPCFDDVRNLNKSALDAKGISEINVITGGFPCQDLSISGKQEGLKDGTRSSLYGEIIRLAGELRPDYIIMENVSNLLSGPAEQRGEWFSEVLASLASIGYDAEWENIPAATVGAPHSRKRIWIIAMECNNTNGVGIQRQFKKAISGVKTFSWCKNVRDIEDLRDRPNIPKPLFRGTIDGVPNWMDRLKSIGNSVVPDIPELIGNAILDFEGRA